jgi:hypothetical protein
MARAWLLLTKRVVQRDVGTDTGTSPTTRIAAPRAVEVNDEVTPTRGGRREVVRFLVPPPNVAHARQSRACGRPSPTPSTPTVRWRLDASFAQITIPKAIDDAVSLHAQRRHRRHRVGHRASRVSRWTPMDADGDGNTTGPDDGYFRVPQTRAGRCAAA